MGFPVPTVAPDLQTVLDGPRPVATPRRLPASAPVSVCIYKISDSAGDVWDSFQGQEIPMWQIQMDHPVQRPITFQMRDGMNDFLRSAHAANSDMPTDVRALEDAVGVRLVSSRKKSIDKNLGGQTILEKR